MGNKQIKSYDEFERAYFPEAVKKRELENETPEEFGRSIASEVIVLVGDRFNG